MKVLLVVVALVAAANAAKPLRILSVEETTAFDYHNRVGIPLAKRIRETEEQLLADPSRIVGGGPSGLGTHPHLGGALLGIPGGGTSICGCSLITHIRAVTAAHCVTGINQITMVMGSEFLFHGGTRVNADVWHFHENYNSGNLNNDIAMIFHPHIYFTNYVQNINLASGGDTFAGIWAWAVGFGGQGGGQGIGNNQQQHHVQLQVIPNAQCQQVYGGAVIVDSTICTSGANGQGTCGGDSGGPLAVGSGGQRLLIGVVSFVAANGCEAGLPAGYARVSSFEPWIRQRM